MSYTIEENEHVELLLQNLPNLYDHVIINLSNDVKLNLIFDGIASTILEEEMNLVFNDIVSTIFE